MRKVLCIFVCCSIALLCGSVWADFESEVIDLVNAERTTRGLQPLSYDASLAAAARDHSEDMGWQNYFSHTSLDGRTVQDRLSAAGYDFSAYGENIAAGQPTPDVVIDSWMASSGHRANILNPNFCDIGVGYAYAADSTYRHYWTQDFGRKSGISTCPGTAIHEITATAGPGGGISPQGVVSVNQGAEITFRIAPDPGYSVAEVLVDGNAADIATAYTFSNVSQNHTIEASFALNQASPTADAGLPQIVPEGQTVTLDASHSFDSNDGIAAYEWRQISGISVTLSAEKASKPTFVAGPVTEDSVVVFELTVSDTGGLSDSDTVDITIQENGIYDFAEDVLTIQTTTGKVLGLKTDGAAALISLHSVDPEGNLVSDRTGMPANLPYGLIDYQIRVEPPGSRAGIAIFLPEPAAEDHGWYEYSQRDGWYDFSDNVVFNDTRTRLHLELTDGGPGDDDGRQNGIIADPAGLGTAPSPDSISTNTGSSGGGSGGCFIDTLKE